MCSFCYPSEGVQNIEAEKLRGVYSAKTSGTVLKTHLQRYHATEVEAEQSSRPLKRMRQTLLSTHVHNVSKQRKVKLVRLFSTILIFQSELDFALFHWLASHNLPFHYVRHKEFAQFLQLAVPGYVLPATQTLTSLLSRECDLLRSQLKATLGREMVGASLSADGWTSRAGVSYFALLLHSIRPDGRKITVQLEVPFFF